MVKCTYKLETQGVYWGNYSYCVPNDKVLIQLRPEQVGQYTPQLVIATNHFKKLIECKVASIIDFFVVAENVTDVDGEYMNFETHITYSFNCTLPESGKELAFSFTVLQK